MAESIEIMELEHFSEVVNTPDTIEKEQSECLGSAELDGPFDDDVLLSLLKEMFGLEFDEEDLVFTEEDEKKGIYKVLVRVKKKGRGKKPDKQFHYEVRGENNEEDVYDKDFSVTLEILNHKPEEEADNGHSKRDFQTFDYSLETDRDDRDYVKPVNVVKVTFGEGNPLILNGQKVYQSFFFKSRTDSDIYENLEQMASRSGMDIEIEERGYIDERDGKRYVGKYVKKVVIDGKDIVDGSEINGERVFLEFYRNDEIVKDDLSVKEGDLLEGRIGTETKNGCGGGGVSVEKLKYILENDNFKVSFGVLEQHPYSGVLGLSRSSYF